MFYAAGAEAVVAELTEPTELAKVAQTCIVYTTHHIQGLVGWLVCVCRSALCSAPQME